MNYQTTKDKQTEILKAIERRLAFIAPTPEELTREEFLHLVAKTPLSEIVELEQTDPTCTARRNAIEQEREDNLVYHAKIAGAKPSDFERVAFEAGQEAARRLREYQK